MEKHAEILAPAGGEAQLRAAVLCGADAVYLGLRGFNARAGAENFDENTLPQTVGWCHARGVRVYVTLNTLVTDRELPQWLHSLDAVAAAGVDGVLVQDLGLAKIIRQRYPTLPLHASTQMTIHNLAGARLLEEMGFAQVVLARELSKEEIAAICAGTSMRCEVFVHGALCMSVSGQCYLSSVLGERSGNRGRCAQPCRLDFKSHGRGYALSLKDLTLTDRLRELEALGVASFKIEGRLKRPEYVAAAVTACRQSLAGEVPDLETLQSVFSRSGFTLTDCTINSPEFGWKCSGISLSGGSLVSEYAFFDSKGVSISGLDFSGKYSFQYMENLTITDSNLDTKDAFWHSRNVTVKNSTVKGEYLAWFSDGLTLEHCRIIGTQPLCYSKNLRLIDCEMIDTDLAFEYSEVEADIRGGIDSVVNPLSGKIICDSLGELVSQPAVMDCHGEVIIRS